MYLTNESNFSKEKYNHIGALEKIYVSYLNPFPNRGHRVGMEVLYRMYYCLNDLLSTPFIHIFNK